MPLTRRAFLQTTALAGAARVRGLAAMAQLAAPFQPTWASLRDHYTRPAWLTDHRLGIFIHWGLYAVPAHGNEWYAKHMYTSDVAWHTEHYGPPDKFG
jgi:alpha-L-fucosidase